MAIGNDSIDGMDSRLQRLENARLLNPPAFDKAITRLKMGLGRTLVQRAIISVIDRRGDGGGR